MEETEEARLRSQAVEVMWTQPIMEDWRSPRVEARRTEERKRNEMGRGLPKESKVAIAN